MLMDYQISTWGKKEKKGSGTRQGAQDEITHTHGPYFKM